MNIKKMLVGLGLALGLTGMAMALYFGPVTLVNKPIAYTQSFTQNMQSTGLSNITVSAQYSSAPFAAVSFSNGSASTGTITISNWPSLLATSATDQITIGATASLLAGTPATFIVTTPAGRGWGNRRAFALVQGIDWLASPYGSTSTAANLNTALAACPYFTTSVSSNVISLTAAQAGSAYNNVQFYSSTSAITVASTGMAGGYDNATLTILGRSFTQGNGWTAATSNAATANSLALAIQGNAFISSLVTITSGPAAGTAGVLYATSTIDGVYADFGWTSSTGTTGAAMTLSSTTMLWGANSSWVLNSATITIPAHGLVTGMPVVISSPAALIPTPLVQGTTYWVDVIDANNIALAGASTAAVAGITIPITSSSTQAGATSFTLSPLTPAGAVSIYLTASNDGNSFYAVAGSSYAFTLNGSLTAGTTSWALGIYPYTYLRATVSGVNQGAMNVNMLLQGQ